MTDDLIDELWLDDAQMRDWRSVVGLVMALPAALDAQLKRDTGLNMFEYHVLAALSATEHGALPMSELAGMSQGSPSRLSHAVSRLESSGLVERRACVEAGRRTAAHLTEAGRAKLDEAAPSHVREVRRLVIDRLDATQLAALGDAARTVAAAIDDPACTECIEPQL